MSHDEDTCQQEYAAITKRLQALHDDQVLAAEMMAQLAKTQTRLTEEHHQLLQKWDAIVLRLMKQHESLSEND